MSDSLDLFPEEIRFENKTTSTVYIKCYPISMIFNGNLNYDLICKNRYSAPNSNLQFDYINGVYLYRNLPDTSRLKKTVLELPGNNARGFQFDLGDHEENYGSVGFGMYKIIFFSDIQLENIIDTLTLEYDAGYGISLSPDVIFYINSGGRISFQWGGSNERNIYDNDVNRKIVSWNQYEQGSRTKNYGNYLYDTANSNSYIFLPHDSRKDCNVLINIPEQNHVFNDNRSGILMLNLTIDKNISTRDTLIDNPTNIAITKNVLLRINDEKTFNMNTPSYPSNGYTNLIIGEDSAKLQLRPYSLINVYYPNKVTLKSGGFLLLNPNSVINVYPGAYFCDEGGNIRGSGRVIFRGGLHQNLCLQIADYLIKDSVIFIVDSNAFLPIPNNTTLHIKGNTTSLILKAGSKLLFGENSGIVCDSGGKLIANNAVFTSVDSTKKWNGISLSDLSQDTIKNCTIKNAMYGITVSEKYDAEDTGIPYSTEISGCGFINQTNYVLNNGVYVAGSNNTLLMNNTISSTSLEKGFTHGIYAEYCPEGSFNIIGNNISSAGNGMTLIGCSPFVAQNILTGNEYSECGMFLDNSNGTIEYNIITDFYYSYFSYYSSPNLLKNVFDNSFDDIIYLSTYSVPVMRPLVSGNLTYWFSGDNLITGSPANCGINFGDETYPDMNYGYNRFILSNNDYFINGTCPSNWNRDFDVFENYWGEGVPDSNKFLVYDANVEYIPYDDNSSEARQTNHDTLYDIGFGLFDTVYYNDESDNPGTAEEIYLKAYKNEYSGNYTQAIELYKTISEEFKDSSYAASSLSRIFNCYEKKNSNQSEFNSLEAYYQNIESDTTYSELLRNISEDFKIKSKVKQYNFEEAISDYNTIYNQNFNTPKGTHALLNKEILIAMNSAGGDNAQSGMRLESIISSQNIINEIISSIRNKKINITSKTNLPDNFILYQNYPNPFNPTTKIDVSIPKTDQVTLKIYDITGREVRTLINNQTLLAGKYTVDWNSLDGKGIKVSSGVYFYRIQAGGFVNTKKMMLIK